MRTPVSHLLHRTAAAVAAGETSSSAAPPSTLEQQQTAPVGMAVDSMAVDSNMVVILASLLCVLVCVLGLALVSRCACRRRRTSSSDHSPPPPKGLKKKVIDALPTVLFAVSPHSSTSPATASAVAWCLTSECAICLTEFDDGESVRVLPVCGHGFHGVCVDAWLRTHASCPSCRAAIVALEPAMPAPAEPTIVVVVAGGGSRCGRCGELAAPAGSSPGDATFLP